MTLLRLLTRASPAEIFEETCDGATRDGPLHLHRRHGPGRTGTFLASRSIWRGMGAADAIADVRRKILKTQRTLAGAIEPSQEAALFAFERTLRPAKRA